MSDTLAMLLILGATGLFTFLMVLGALWFTPQMSRPSIFFAVTVDPSLRKTPFAADCIRRFRRGVLVHSAIGLAILIGLGVATWLLLSEAAIGVVLGLVIGVFWQVIGSHVVFASIRRDVLPHGVRPTTVREASLVPRTRAAGRGRLLAAMILAPLLMIACCALYLWIRWDDIPPQFVSHWGPHGADTWTNKSIVGVFWPFLLGLATYIPLLLVGLFIARARRVHASGPGAVQEQRFTRYTLLILMLLGCFAVGLVCGVTVYLPLRESQDPPTLMIAMIVAANLLLDTIVMVALIRMGQGGSRLAVEPAQAPPAGPEVIGDRTDDRYWKWGIFYNNPNDPALWVEKRFGIGWTINVARPGAWAAIIALTAPGLILPLVIILAVELAAPDAMQHAPSTRPAAQSRHANFEDDPQLVGKWQSVDFVPRIEDFDPANRKVRGDLFLKQLVVEPGGAMAEPQWQWTRGKVFQSSPERPGLYEIRQIEGQTYLFLEWISGDVTIRGMKPQYYVLRKTSS